jgi:hypothetical protein
MGYEAAQSGAEMTRNDRAWLVAFGPVAGASTKSLYSPDARDFFATGGPLRGTFRVEHRLRPLEGA